MTRQAVDMLRALPMHLCQMPYANTSGSAESSVDWVDLGRLTKYHLQEVEAVEINHPTGN